MTRALLRSRAALRVEGPEAAHFLQGLITADVARVDASSAGYGALLTPQGKILFDFLILKDGEAYLFDCPRDAAAALAKRLGFYKLRAKVTITDLSDSHAVVAAWDEDPALAGVFAPDPRLAALGSRGIVSADEAGKAELADEAAWHAHRIGLGVPEAGEDYAYGEVFPHDIDMDQLGGVTFDKGCYVGQEVVSRMEHRGTARRRIIRATADATLPPAGTEIVAGGKTLGTLGSSSGPDGLALVRLDRTKAALDAGTAITAGDTAVALTLPDWAGFGWPAQEAEPS